MNIRTEYSEGTLYIRLEGELDHHAAAGALRSMERMMDRYLPKNCALDMSGLTFMDSSGIAVILRAQRRMADTGGRLWLVQPSEQSGRVLRASGIGRLIRIKYTEGRRVK